MIDEPIYKSNGMDAYWQIELKTSPRIIVVVMEAKKAF
jgi:hypothetical protein